MYEVIGQIDYLFTSDIEFTINKRSMLYLKLMPHTSGFQTFFVQAFLKKNIFFIFKNYSVVYYFNIYVVKTKNIDNLFNYKYKKVINVNNTLIFCVLIQICHKYCFFQTRFEPIF